MQHRAVLVDDHVVVREGLKRLLEGMSDVVLVGEASNGPEAVVLLTELKPDLALIDVSMPEMSGIEVATQVARASPKTRILALTVHEDEAYVLAFMKAGAHGYLLKRASTDELLRAIHAVAAGGVYVDPRVSGALIKGMIRDDERSDRTGFELSEREAEVLRQVARGYSHKEVALQLDLSVKTVETYRTRAMEKLGLKDRVGIVRFAYERDWLKPQV